MDCTRVKSDDLVERYLLGELSETEQDGFEEHYFECEACFEELETRRAWQGELRRSREAILAEPASSPRFATWGWVAVAASVLVAVGVGVWLPSPQPSGIADLAHIEAPAYSPARLRGAADEATRAFRDAMEHYATGDYAAAIPGLQAAAKLDPQAPYIHFFLGACQLLSDQAEAGIDSLENTLGLGESPYMEEALLYLARAHLGRGDVSAARAELRRLVGLQGELESEARAMLDRLGSRE